MKTLFFLLALWVGTGCRQRETNGRVSPQSSPVSSGTPPAYTPGLGEFMESVQVHHNKLWFAGINSNWPLAGFERDEIREVLDNINTYCRERPEIKKLPLLLPALDSMDAALGAGSKPQFIKSFQLLTASCNACHRATGHAFNVIIIPLRPPFSNQEFKPEAKP